VTAGAGDKKELQDPCLHSGFKRDAAAKRQQVFEGPDGAVTVTGQGSSQQCLPALEKLFANKQSCDVQHTKPFSFDCTHQPAFVAASENFLVFENFYYVSSAVGIGAKGAAKSGSQFPLVTSPASFKEAAGEVCSADWTNAQTAYPKDGQPKDVTVKLCFGASYAHQFLTKGLGLSEDKKVTIQKEVRRGQNHFSLPFDSEDAPLTRSFPVCTCLTAPCPYLD